MKSQVYFLSVRTDKSLVEGLGQLFEKAFPEIIKKDDLCAVKVHFGELGSHAFINPVFVRKIVEKIKENGAKPFLADSNTLYTGHRHNSVDHLENAIANGFGYSTVQAPLVIADGLHGLSFKEIEVNLKHFKKVKIGSEFVEADSLIVVSHATGHMDVGYAGAIKNVGMGCASRAGKQQQHTDSKPKVNQEKCISCKKCQQICSVNAINFNNNQKKAFIDQKICTGCDQCVTVCPTHAIAIMWGEMGKKETQERIVEYTYGVLKGKRAGFINFLMNITPDCDCFGRSDAYFVQDIGILASKDIVAIEKATVYLIEKQEGNPNSRLKNPKTKDKFKDIYDIESKHQIIHAEKIGLGNQEYELIKIN